MSGWKIKYSELFSLSIQQSFYENGICKKNTADSQPDFLILSTLECQELMKRLDFVFRPVARQAGCIVLSRTTANSTNDTVLRFPSNADGKLSFWMILQNPDLLTFNNLPARSEPDKIWYFSNEVTDVGVPRNNLHLSTDATGVNSANDLIKTSSPDYHFHHGSVVTPHSAFVKHLTTGSLVPAKTIVNQAGQAYLSFDLSSLPLGKCKLIISGADVDNFYYMGSTSLSVFGVVEIFLSPSLDANYRTVETGNVLTTVRPFYTIQFNNRKTLWRYTIVLEKNNPIYIAMQAMSPGERTSFVNHFKIVSTNDTNITFTQSLVNDTTFEFVSGNVITLQEKYVSSLDGKGLRLTLKKNEGIAGESIVRDYLPFPSNVLIDALNDPTIYSDIFLTI